MAVNVQLLDSSHASRWDTYVSTHGGATLYHLCGWRDVIRKAYGHRSYYLAALEDADGELSNRALKGEGRIVGVLPLVHLKHPLFGNSLVSIPFFDMGGILANDSETEAGLLRTALVLAGRLRADSVELRQTEKALEGSLSSLGYCAQDPTNPSNPITYVTKSHKVRMLLELPESSGLLMDSFKAKLRSQIKKPVKEGLTSRIGARELLDDFYKVFSVNMRDLGSPVHSRTLIAQVLDVFSESARIIVVYKNDSPVACSVVIGFGDTLENPWASSLREYSKLSPNMLLYWSILEYACDHGFKCFDFGRSSPDEGTYRFKEQWGAKPMPLYWHYVSLDGKSEDTGGLEKSKYKKAVQYWKKLPVPITRVIGPMIRKHIAL